MSFAGPKYIHYQGQDYKKIKNKYQKNTLLFEDPEFTADNRSIYYSDKAKVTGIQWLRPPEISEDPHLFNNEASSRDITQGRVGNCWFVAACASLANEKSLWKQIIPDHKEQDWDPKHLEKYVGIFHFRFWRFGDWIDIVIDDRLPTVQGELVFTHSRTRNEFWISLLEKAYAKLNGCYEALDGGNLSDALVDFTGGICENIELNPALSQPILSTIITPNKTSTYRSQLDGDGSKDATAPVDETNNPFNERNEVNDRLIIEPERPPSPPPPSPFKNDANAIFVTHSLIPNNTSGDNFYSQDSKLKDSIEKPSIYVRDKFFPLENPFDSSKRGRENQTCEGDRYNCGNFEERKALFKVLLREVERKSLMCAAIDVANESEIETKTLQGLIRGHAYGITSVRKLFTKDTSIIDFTQLFKFNRRLGIWRRTKQQESSEASPNFDERRNKDDSTLETTPNKFYMIRLKNPWGGKNEWNGPFSDGSPEWEKITHNQREKLGLTFEDDGEFWMTFDDFCQNFTHLSICYVLNTSYLTFGKTWHEAIIWSKWIDGPYGSKTDRAGGCVNFESFLRNPQCLLTLHDSTSQREEILFYLTQKDRREFKMYEKSQNLTIGFSLFKVEENRMYRLHDVRNCQKIGQSDYINSRSIFLRCFLPCPGKYIILPTTFKPKDQGDFMFRVYCSSRVDFKLAKIDYPKRHLFSGCFGYPNCVYRITVKQATALEKQESIGSNTNPYVIIYCEKFKYRTRTVKATLNPVWNETYLFYCKKRTSVIRIEIWNSNVLRDSFMGQVEINPRIDEMTQNLEMSLLGRNNSSEPMPGTILLQITASDNIKSFF